ncbi:MAG: hypothetical protein HY974_00385, partial [Candidatus Kerfeldbacteria bacterium]|nr:hypothetical protein [Candidatus Kerfeldbacteria bacterium]
MPTPTLRSHWPTKVATLTLPTREASVIASVWPTSGGTLILLAELNLAPTPRAELATTAQATLERCLNDITIQTDVETSLEKAALALNQDLKSRERLFGNPLAPRYHFCLAVLRSNLLALANIGYLQAFVAAPNRLTDIFSSSSKRRQGTQALFQHIVSGQLEPGETLVLTSPSLTEFFTQDKLRQLFSLRTPGLALREAEQIINSLPHHPPLGVIALKLEELPSEQAGFQPSLEHLLQTKDDTSSLLKPKLWSYLKKRFSLSQRRKPPEKLTTGDELPAGDYSLTVTPEPEATALAKSGTYHPDSLRNKLARTASQLAWLTSRAGVKTMVSYWLTDKIISWRRLSYAKRVLLVLAALVLMAFSQSIVSLGRNQLKSRDSENYNQLVASLTEQQAVVEAAVIYHDDAKAQLLLNQAYELLAQLPHNTSSRKQQQQTLTRNLDTLARRLRHQAEATTAEPWLELPGGATWRYLGLIGNSLYALSAGSQIAPLGLDGKIGSIFTLPTSLDQPLALTPLNQQYFLAWGNNGSALIDLTSR